MKSFIMSPEDDKGPKRFDLAACVDAVIATGEGGKMIVAEGEEAKAKGLIDSIKIGLQPTDPNVIPCEVPTFPSGDGFYLFCVRILEDDWLKKHALIISFPGPTGGRIIAFTLGRDREFWNSIEGWAHLRSSDLYFYTVEQYANAVLDEFFRERGVCE